MSKKLRNHLTDWVANLHLKVFGTTISPQMKKFLSNLSWSLLGGGIANAVVMFVNIFSGRLMGPEEFGRYSLTLVICSYLFVPIYFGLDVATVKMVAKTNNEEEKKQYVSSAGAFILFMAIVVSVLVLLFKKQFGEIFSTSVPIIIYSVFFAFFLTVRNSLDNFLRSLSYFKYQFRGKILESSLIIIAFIASFFILKKFVYSSYINILAVGAIGVSLLYLYRLKDYLRSFDWEKLKQLISHGKFFMFCAIMATFFISLDRLVINRYLTPYDLGLYGAYYGVSITLVTQGTQMFNNAFFPAVAQSFNRSAFRKLNRLILVGFIPMFLVITAVIFIALKLFGSQYQIIYSYLLVFGLFGSLQAIYLVFTYVVSSLAKAVYKKYLVRYILVNLLNVAIYALLILTNNVSILFILLSLCLNYALIILMQRSLIQKNI